MIRLSVAAREVPYLSGTIFVKTALCVFSPYILDFSILLPVARFRYILYRTLSEENCLFWYELLPIKVFRIFLESPCINLSFKELVL